MPEQREELVELDEILRYHLEQPHAKQELGQADPTLAERAGKRLAVAGRRASGAATNGPPNDCSSERSS